MNAGSWQAIKYEIRHGDALTVLDELWHAVEWLAPHIHWCFCQWCHNRRDA